MDDLRIDLLSRILRQLPLVDKLRCRQVCKRFLYVVDNQSSKCLAIIQKSKLFTRTVWFDDYTPIDHASSILFKRTNLRVFESKLFESRFFINLQKLFLDFGAYEKSRNATVGDLIGSLNRFQQLETLHIDLTANRPNKNEKLYLQNLKNLKISSIPPNSAPFIGSNAHLIFDTQQLERLEIVNGCEFLKFLRPATVKQIKLDGDIVHSYAFVQQFPDLRCLDYREFKIEDYATLKQLVLQHGTLRELCLTCYQNANLDELRECSERRSIAIYVNGIQIRCWIKFSSFEQRVLERYNLNIFLENYTYTHPSELTSLIDINYSAWELEWLNNRIPEDFQRKLVRLCSIYVNKKVEQFGYFLRFLSGCKMIHTIKLVDSALDQASFYSRINCYLPFLTTLIIQDDQRLLKQIDFAFLLKLRHLERFVVNCQLKLELIRDLFLKLGNLKEIEMMYNDQLLIIRKQIKNSSRFRATDNDCLKQFAAYLSEQCSKDVSFAIGHFIEDSISA